MSGVGKSSEKSSKETQKQEKNPKCNHIKLFKLENHRLVPFDKTIVTIISGKTLKIGGYKNNEKQCILHSLKVSSHKTLISDRGKSHSFTMENSDGYHLN
jgi:hypothetical protein